MKVFFRKYGGEIDLRAPKIATCFEYVTLWSSSGEDTAQLGRVCAGALGVCLDYKAIFPRYRAGKMSAMEYGHLMLDRLLSEGITGTAVFREGVKCLQFMTERIPTQKEVDERANFSSSPDMDIST